MRVDRSNASGMRPARRRLGLGVVLAVLAMVAAGIAVGVTRRSKENEARVGSSAHGMHSASGEHAGGAPSNPPAELGAAEAKAKALGELGESRDQVERMKAQGIGRPATER